MDKGKNIIITIETTIILLLFVQQTFAQKKAVEAPTYKPVVAQTDIKPFHLEDLDMHRRLAVSRDLLSEGFMIGDIVCIDGAVDGYNGYWFISKIMNKRWANKIDFLDSQTFTVSGSRWENVTVWENVAIELIGHTHINPVWESIYGKIKYPEREY